jgi:hypothetical protein
MHKFGLYSDKSAIPFENHLEGLEEETKTIRIIYALLSTMDLQKDLYLILSRTECIVIA